jgi:hypothetical protein
MIPLLSVWKPGCQSKTVAGTDSTTPDEGLPDSATGDRTWKIVFKIRNHGELIPDSRKLRSRIRIFARRHHLGDTMEDFQ